MFLLENIGSGFSLQNPLHVCVEIILLKQEHTFYINVHNIGDLKTLRENLS